MTKQRREREASGPTRAKTGQSKLRKPTWTEFIRLADQAVVAIAGADMINRAEPRACGCSRGFRHLYTKRPETGEPPVLRQTQPGRVSKERRMTRLASALLENPPYGMNRGGGGNIGMTRGLFAAMLERADTKEAIGLNPVAPPPYSTSISSVTKNFLPLARLYPEQVKNNHYSLVNFVTVTEFAGICPSKELTQLRALLGAEELDFARQLQEFLRGLRFRVALEKVTVAAAGNDGNGDQHLKRGWNRRDFLAGLGGLGLLLPSVLTKNLLAAEPDSQEEDNQHKVQLETFLKSRFPQAIDQIIKNPDSEEGLKLSQEAGSIAPELKTIVDTSVRIIQQGHSLDDIRGEWFQFGKSYLLDHDFYVLVDLENKKPRFNVYRVVSRQEYTVRDKKVPAYFVETLIEQQEFTQTWLAFYFGEMLFVDKTKLSALTSEIWRIIHQSADGSQALFVVAVNELLKQVFLGQSKAGIEKALAEMAIIHELVHVANYLGADRIKNDADVNKVFDQLAKLLPEEEKDLILKETKSESIAYTGELLLCSNIRYGIHQVLMNEYRFFNGPDAQKHVVPAAGTGWAAILILRWLTGKFDIAIKKGNEKNISILRYIEEHSDQEIRKAIAEFYEKLTGEKTPPIELEEIRHSEIKVQPAPFASAAPVATLIAR